MAVIIEPFPVTNTILVQMKSIDGGAIIPIIRNDPNHLRNRFGVIQSYQSNGFLSELYAYFEGNSLATTPLPEIFPEESETSRTNKTLSMLWSADHPKYYLGIWMAKVLNPGENDWFYRGKIPLQRQAGYPYALSRMMDLLTDNITRQFGENFCLGLSIQDAGFGLLKPNDTLVIDGTWIQDNRIFKPEIVPIVVQGGTVQQTTQRTDSKEFNLGGSVRRQIFDANTRRISASVQNRATTGTIFLAYRDYTPTSSNRDAQVNVGTTIQLPLDIFGPVWATSSTTSLATTTNEVYQNPI